MAFEKRIRLQGSEGKIPAGARQVGAAQEEGEITVTLVLRRGKGSEAHHEGHLTHEQFRARYGIPEKDMTLLRQFAEANSLKIAESNPSKNTIKLTGTLDAMQKAFGTQLHRYQHENRTFRAQTSGLTIPEEMGDMVLAVLGLDTRPIATPHFRIARATRVNQSFTPLQVAELYHFPSGLDGSGQTIGLIELGGGFQTADLQTYFTGLGVKQPSVTAVAVDGGKNAPGSDADGEVMLDIEVAGAIAPGANIAVYFAPNTDQGFVDAVTDAVHDTARKPSVISISWGGSEDSWTEQARQAMDQAFQDAGTLGVTVIVAAGDNGSDDGQGDKQLHVDFPASSPHVLACGGTTLSGSGTTIRSETVWNESANNEGVTGGGVSRYFALPSYQNQAGVPIQPETKFAGRGVPDVAGDADPATGYKVRVDGQDEVVGGTSAVAPLWAALIALSNQQSGKSAGLVNTALYANASAFRDITQGNNGSGSGAPSYSAKAGWDACTGLGTPNGAAVAKVLGGGTAAKGATSNR
jgi:kumamolisin